MSLLRLALLALPLALVSVAGILVAQDGDVPDISGTYSGKAKNKDQDLSGSKEVGKATLSSGDLVEVGQGGPLIRFRLPAPGSRGYKTMGEAFGDCVDAARHGSRGPVGRAALLLAGTTRELLTQTSPLIRLSVFMLLALLLITATVGIGNWRLGRELA